LLVQISHLLGRERLLRRVVSGPLPIAIKVVGHIRDVTRAALRQPAQERLRPAVQRLEGEKVKVHAVGQSAVELLKRQLRLRTMLDRVAAASPRPTIRG